MINSVADCLVCFMPELLVVFNFGEYQCIHEWSVSVFSGPFQSWLVTRTPWWQFHCMTRSARRPSPTLSTRVHLQAPTTHPLQSNHTILDQGNWCKVLNSVLWIFFFSPAAISTVICDVPEKVRLILDCVSGKGKTVKMIVLMEAIERDLVTRAEECGIKIISLKEFEVRLTTFSYYLILCLLS